MKTVLHRLPDDFHERLEAKFGGRATPADVAAFFDEVIPGLTATEKMDLSTNRLRELDEKKAELLVLREKAVKLHDAFDDLIEWLKQPLFLERPSTSITHQIRAAARDRSILNVQVYCNREAPDDLEQEILSKATCFLIQHDWAAAFAGATDYAEGEFRLPFEVCAFEFRIGGRRLVALAIDVGSQVRVTTVVETKLGWLVPDLSFDIENGQWNVPKDGNHYMAKEGYFNFASFVASQIRAACIAMEANVAESEIVQAPEKLNRARAKAGKPPLSDHHIIYLTRQYKGDARGDGTGTKRRLHFRRGHWRHYEDHRTWIRWTLVGDPDLGFVEKEYRL